MLFDSRPVRGGGLSACEEIMTLSIAVWPQCTIVTDRQTDRQTDRRHHSDNTDSLACHAAMSRQNKTEVKQAGNGKETETILKQF